MTKKDYYLVTLIGFLVGCLILLPAKNIGFNVTLAFIFVSIVGFTLFAPLALFILKTLGKRWPVFEQFGKFAAVGTLNTLLYFAVINLLMLLTDISKGSSYSIFVVLGSLISATNSYLWNKFWTFGSRLPISFKEIIKFVSFTLIGALINTSVASLIVNEIGAPTGVDPKLWANIGALVAVFAGFLWNFLSYRKFVFKND